MMIKLKDFLEIANSPIMIQDEINNAILIDDDYFDKDILSEKLLNSEVAIVEPDSSGKYIIVELNGGI